MPNVATNDTDFQRAIFIVCLTQFLCHGSVAVANAESFFRNLAQAGMSESERVVHNLKIQRSALLRQANEYARALNRIEQHHVECSTRLESRHGPHDLHGRRYHDKVKRQAAAHLRAMAKLNADFPLGAARDQLRAINVKIAKAVAEFQRSWSDDRKPGEHFSTRRINGRGVN